jgi:6-phosphogluconolactonase/glucosamine-6-phosphate isomerase/deaminase
VCFTFVVCRIWRSKESSDRLAVAIGPTKAEALKTVLEGAYDPENAPAQMINPSQGTLLWIVDEAAAIRLSQRPLGNMR